MADFGSDLIRATHDTKGDIADAIGMPDEKDYEVLLGIIQRFERKYPGLIKAAMEEGRRDFHDGIHRKNLTWKNDTVVNKDSHMTYAFEIPATLYMAIEQVFPSMFKSKKHLRWFKKNFYKLTIRATYK